MKKSLFCLILLLIAACSGVSVEVGKTNKAKAQSPSQYISNWQDFNVAGMHYTMRYCNLQSDGSYGGPSGTTSVQVINVTKDSLECAYYKYQLRNVR